MEISFCNNARTLFSLLFVRPLVLAHFQSFFCHFRNDADRDVPFDRLTYPSIIVIKRDKNKINSIEMVKGSTHLQTLLSLSLFFPLLIRNVNWIKSKASNRTQNRMNEKKKENCDSIYEIRSKIEALLLDRFIVIYSYFFWLLLILSLLLLLMMMMFILLSILNLCCHPGFV